MFCSRYAQRADKTRVIASKFYLVEMQIQSEPGLDTLEKNGHKYYAVNNRLRKLAPKRDGMMKAARQLGLVFSMLCSRALKNDPPAGRKHLGLLTVTLCCVCRLHTIPA